MSELIKVNIGIPAYNEGSNIHKLLLQILEQEEAGFIINNVFVISDGSSDDTVSEAEKISDPRLVIVNNTDRKGKAVRFNELLKLSDSEIIVQLDADIKLENKHVISELVKVIVGGGDLAFSKIAPVTPRTYIEKVAYFGIFAWEKVLDQMPKEYLVFHRCAGRCRAFSKQFYKTFVLPIAADSVEDVYSFCFAVTKGFKPVYVPDALIRYRLPSTMKDFIKQTRRFVKGPQALSQFYGKEMLEKYTPTTRIKLIALFKSFFRFWPHISLGYIVLQLYSRNTATMDNQKPVYEYVGSTKQLE